MTFIIFLVPLILTAQVTRNGSPISWSLESEIDVSVSYHQLESVDYEELIAEDAVSVLEKSAPSRFAYGHEVLLNLENSGRWVTLNNGDRVWLLGIQSTDALSLGVTFGEFYMPRGARMFIYTENRQDVLGAITDQNNNEARVLGTRPLTGGEIIVEYYEPYGVRGMGELEIRTVAEAYRDQRTEYRDFSMFGNCQENVICLEHREMIDRVDATLLILVDDGTRSITGTMVNNSGNDERPLVITKAGPGVGSTASWVFVFDYKSKNCEVSSKGTYNKTIGGGMLLAEHGPSETALVEMNVSPPGNWNVFYAGWSRKDEIPWNVYSLHHPEGDVMKYSISDNISKGEFGYLPSWEVNWAIGTTEKGAVGSALFDDQGLIIGNFQHGNFNCTNTSSFDSYFRFSAMWSSFKDFLDPNEGNQTSLLGKFGGIEPSDSEIIHSNIAIFPNPASDHITIYNGSDEDIASVRFFDINGRLCLESTLEYQRVDVSVLPPGVYFMEIKLSSYSQLRKVVVQ